MGTDREGKSERSVRSGAERAASGEEAGADRDELPGPGAALRGHVAARRDGPAAAAVAVRAGPRPGRRLQPALPARRALPRRRLLPLLQGLRGRALPAR